MNDDQRTLEYEYRGLMATTWDLLRGDPSGRYDREFYFEMIEKYWQPVLDVGCGTGRLLLDFLERGSTLRGLMFPPEMLALCREKGLQQGLTPTLYEQAIETLELPRRYRTILAPSSVLQLIPDSVAARQAVDRLFAHLLPGGALVSPFMTLWREGMAMEQEWENTLIRDTDGAVLQRMGRIWYDPLMECEHTEDLYQVFVDGEVVAAEHHRRSPANRSYTQEQARKLYELAGFVEVQVLRGFTNKPAGKDDMLFTVIGVKAQ